MLDSRLSFILLAAIIVLFLGYGAALILSQMGWLLGLGYGLIGFGMLLAAVGLYAFAKQFAQNEETKSPLDLAEETLDRRQRERHLRATEPGLRNVLAGQNSTTRRQEARAERVRKAHRQGRAKD